MPVLFLGSLLSNSLVPRLISGPIINLVRVPNLSKEK